MISVGAAMRSPLAGINHGQPFAGQGVAFAAAGLEGFPDQADVRPVLGDDAGGEPDFSSTGMSDATPFFRAISPRTGQFARLSSL